MSQVIEKKWEPGMQVTEGCYIQPKIMLVPEQVEQETADGKVSHTQLHRRWKGAGRFKSGLAIGCDNKNLPITMLVDIRLGKAPSQAKSSPSITPMDL